MKYSTKCRYALRLMMELAVHPADACISLKEVSEHQQISLKYLEQIVTPLARARLVKSLRGSQGGYQLVKPPDHPRGGREPGLHPLPGRSGRHLPPRGRVPRAPVLERAGRRGQPIHGQRDAGGSVRRPGQRVSLPPRPGISRRGPGHTSPGGVFA